MTFVAGLPAGLATSRCLVMGVLNVTPDSFSDGGRFVHVETAVAQGIAMTAAGADLIDVGGESTRPGAQRIDAGTERERVVPVVAQLAASGVAVSVDTMRAEVAAAACDAGAVLVNDVSGGQSDPAMLAFLAARGTPCVLMHWRGHSDRMMSETTYAHGVVAGVVDELERQRDAAVKAGVEPARIVLDPGLGFAKEPADNWPLIAGLSAVQALGHPVIVGASRKRFLGELAARRGRETVADQRDALTAAVSAIVAFNGAWAVRVHDVASSRDAVDVAMALRQARVPGDSW